MAFIRSKLILKFILYLEKNIFSSLSFFVSVDIKKTA